MNSINVVLIEDHELTRFGIQTVLKQSGWINVVGEAANGREGLKLIEATQPDVAIVDIGLPDIDGILLTQQYKASIEQQVENQAKVLMLTLQDNEETVLAAFAAGADSYCMKDDIKLEKLLEALRVTSEGYSWIDPAIAKIILQQNRRGQVKTNSVEPHTVSIGAVNPELSQLIEAYPLTDREREVLQLIVNGQSNHEIGQKLYITVGTVKTHVRNILNKLCADDRTQAAVLALRSGLVA
jgi:DNA-binding NarL/FixJ family response regulator